MHQRPCHAVVFTYPHQVITFFATPTDGIVLQDVLPVEHPMHALLGFQVGLRAPVRVHYCAAY